LYAWLACPRRARAAALVGIPCLAIALPWYAGHWRPVLENALDAGYGTPALVQGTGPIFSARTILIYAGNVARSGISEYFAALAGVLIVLSPSRLMDPSFRFVLLWMLPIVIFVFGGNKDVRYIAPVLPGVALLIAALLDSKLPRHRWGTVAGVLVFVFPVLSLLAVSFGVPWRAEGRGYARVYDPRPWPQEEMLRLAAAYAAPGQVPRPLLLAGSDRAGFNANNLELTAAALRLPLRIESTAHEASAAVLLDRLDEAEFFLYKEGGEPESEVFNPHFAALAERVRSGGDFVEIPYGKTLPDGGRARLFRRSPRAATAEPREEFVIPFGAEMALTSMRVEQSAGLVRVHYVWRQLAKLPRQYWSFTHLVDASDRIVAQSDRVVAGEPGRARQQEIRIPLPGDAARAGLRIRFGLYHPPEGVRLRPGSVPPGLALGIAPADHGTALVLAFR
jgi:hypothetical protein